MRKVYKLLIVEDERWEREGLVALIDCDRYGISEVFVASDGFEGLRCIEQNRPEIIITDIRMPGLTGLEMLEQAGEMTAGSVCIILSGYNEFAYAQKALRIGAADFLVKPLNEKELNDCMERAVGTLKELPGNTANDPAAQRMEALFSGGLPVQQVRELLGVQTMVGLYTAVYSGIREGAVVPLYSRRQDGNTVMILRSQDRLPEAGFDTAGIARVEKEDGLQQALQQAEKAMQLARFHRMEKPYVIAEAGREQHVSQLRQRAERVALEHAMATLDEERVQDAITGVRLRMMQDMNIDYQQAMHQIRALTDGMMPNSTELTYAHTLDGMLDIAQARLIERVRQMQQQLSEPERYVVRRVIQLVDENYYNPDVNLQALAGQIFLSPNYVGSLFKKSTGVSFSDYLCSHRLMAAEKLLVEKGMRVSSVAEAVGIPNVSYFCVQFRNAYGVTPSNFKKKH